MEIYLKYVIDSCEGYSQWLETQDARSERTNTYSIAFNAIYVAINSESSQNGNAADSVFRNGYGYLSKGLSSIQSKGMTGDANYWFDWLMIGY